MAAVLGRQLADERRPPERREAVGLADRGEAAEQRVDEHDPALGVEGDVVDVEVARGARDLRHVEPVVALVRLAGLERVVEPPELEQRRQEQRLRARPEAHGAVEAALEDRQPAVRLQPDQEQLAALVGREREREVLLGEPARELARRQQLELGHRSIRRRLVHSPPRRASLGATPLRSRWCRRRSGPGAAPGRP